MANTPAEIAKWKKVAKSAPCVPGTEGREGKRRGVKYVVTTMCAVVAWAQQHCLRSPDRLASAQVERPALLNLPHAVLRDQVR